MERREFILNAMQNHCYRFKRWVFDIFSVTQGEDTTKLKPFHVYHHEGFYATVLPNNPEEFTYITQGGQPISVEQSLFKIKEPLKLKAFEVPNLEVDVVTTPGNLFVNYYCFIDALGKKVPYQNGEFDINKVVSDVATRTVDDVPKEQRTDKDKQIYVDEAVKFLSALSSLASFAPLGAPSATKYTMTSSPEVRKMRDKLFEENKDKLDDPVVIAKISDQLSKMDHEYLKQDPDYGFFIKKKALDVGRKKVHVIHGVERDMKGKSVLIKESISEGLKIENLPLVIDTMRDASFNRGAKTALGGEAVKFLFRVFNSSKIVMEDCKTSLGVPINSDEKTLKQFNGRYVLFNGRPFVLNEKTIPTLVGKSLLLRSPGFCQADKQGRNFCLCCMGELFRGSEGGLAVYGSSIASQMMNIFMKAMHGKASSTSRWNLNKTLS